MLTQKAWAERVNSNIKKIALVTIFNLNVASLLKFLYLTPQQLDFLLVSGEQVTILHIIVVAHRCCVILQSALTKRNNSDH